MSFNGQQGNARKCWELFHWGSFNGWPGWRGVLLCAHRSFPVQLLGMEVERE